MLDVAGLTEGRYTELVNLFRLKDARIDVPPVTLNGLSGWGSLGEAILIAWQPHLSAQAGRVVSSVTPLRALVNVGAAAVDVVARPLHEYRQIDGRPMRALVSSSQALLRTAAIETMNVAAKIIVGTQMVLIAAEDTLRFDGDAGADSASANPASSSSSAQQQQYEKQPASVLEGAEQGYTSLRMALGTAAYRAITVPLESYRREGAGGAARYFVRALPTAVLHPVIGTTDAISRTIMGARNALSPVTKLEMDDKYKTR